MPDKRTLEAAESPGASKRPAPERVTRDSNDVLGTLSHPRLRTSAGASVYTVAPAFQQPSAVCSFSFDEERRLWHDDRSKRIYRAPPPYENRHAHNTRAPPVFGADLNYGFDRFVQRDEGVPEHLDALVAALQHRTQSAPHAEQTQIDEVRRRASIVTWRGIITKLCTAYEQSKDARFADPLELNAMLLDHTLYLEEHVSPATRAEKQDKDQDPRLKRFGYYGYAFESYCTTDPNPRTTDDTRSQSDARRAWPRGWSGDVNTNVQWCQVVKTKLGAHRLLIGGEVDAVVPRAGADGGEELVELKTSMQLTPSHRNPVKAAGDRERFEKKLLKFFLQSYLLGIGRIVVGFRDAHGCLTTHDEFDTLRIPRMVRAGLPIPGQFDPSGRPLLRQRSVWEPKDTLGFGDEILTFIRNVVAAHTTDPCSTPRQHHPVFRITFTSPFDHVEIRTLTPTQLSELESSTQPTERIGFLPRSFYDFVLARAKPS